MSFIESCRFNEEDDYENDISLKIHPPESFIVLFLPQKLENLFWLKEVKHSPDHY